MKIAFLILACLSTALASGLDSGVNIQWLSQSGERSSSAKIKNIVMGKYLTSNAKGELFLAAKNNQDDGQNWQFASYSSNYFYLFNRYMNLDSNGIKIYSVGNRDYQNEYQRWYFKNAKICHWKTNKCFFPMANGSIALMRNDFYLSASKFAVELLF